MTPFSTESIHISSQSQDRWRSMTRGQVGQMRLTGCFEALFRTLLRELQKANSLLHLGCEWDQYVQIAMFQRKHGKLRSRVLHGCLTVWPVALTASSMRGQYERSGVNLTAFKSREIRHWETVQDMNGGLPWRWRLQKSSSLENCTVKLQYVYRWWW